MRYKAHILVCTNQKAPGKACCGEERGMALVEAFRQGLRDRGLPPFEYRAQRVGCLDLCAQGPAVMAYPSGRAYTHVNPEQVSEIIEAELVFGKAEGDPPV